MALRVSASALAAAWCLGSTVLAEDSGTFNLLSYNVAGLPPIFNDNDVPGSKEDNAAYIGEHLAEQAYDIVHLQEDFNYNPWLYNKDDHPHRTKWSGPVPFGSGLNTVANYEWSKFSRTKWEKCDLNEGDCLTPKGFTYMRIEIEDIEVDLYNLHADAGDKNGDRKARKAGIEQMLKHMGNNADGRPVIMAGDFNQRWYNDEVSIDLMTDAGFDDAWVMLIKDGEYPERGSKNTNCATPAKDNECEVVDKFFFKSGDKVALNATSFNYVPDVFVQPDGNILSDHNPLLVEFEWSITPEKC